MRVWICVTFLLAGSLSVSVAGSDDRFSAVAPDQAATAAIHRAIGDPDPRSLGRLASEVSPPQLIAAIYRGTRSESLTAIETAGLLADPWPVLPFLAAVMAAPERQSASRATASLLAALERSSETAAAADEVVPGQADQLVEQLLAVAGDRRIALDIRASAIGAQASISRIDGKPRSVDVDLLGDPEAAVRGAAMAMFEPPFGDSDLRLIAEIAAGDEDRVLRGQAAGLLCENALAHGVKAPSPDLRKLLLLLLGEGQVPPAAIAPILGCLARFPPASRADLIDLAIQHPAPEVKSYWEEIIGQPI